jgi:hypothetical protein
MVTLQWRFKYIGKTSDVPQTTKQNQGLNNIIVEPYKLSGIVMKRNAEIDKIHNIMDGDETSNAVNHLVQEFVNGGEYDITDGTILINWYNRTIVTRCDFYTI